MYFSHSRILGFMVPLALGIVAHAQGSGSVVVQQSAFIHAAPEAVWPIASNFADLGWHPAIASTQVLDGGALQAGMRRLITTRDGVQVKESLMSIDPQAMRYVYRMDETPMPVVNFEASLQVQAEGQGSRVLWSAHFTPAAASKADDGRKMVEGFFSYGLQALQARFP